MGFGFIRAARSFPCVCTVTCPWEVTQRPHLPRPVIGVGLGKAHLHLLFVRSFALVAFWEQNEVLKRGFGSRRCIIMGLSPPAEPRIPVPALLPFWSYQLKTLGLARSGNPMAVWFFLMLLSLQIGIFSVIFYLATWSRYFTRKIFLGISEEDILQSRPCTLKEKRIISGAKLISEKV